MSQSSIPATDEAWDERKLGADKAHAVVAADELVAGIDEATEMQLISIRLPKTMIEDFKVIAAFNKGIGYQPLMRQILKRFADSEKRRILLELLDAEKRKTTAKNAAEPTKAVAKQARRASVKKAA